MGTRIERITYAISKSKYFISALGNRDINIDELRDFVRIILNSSDVLQDLDNLYKYHPSTIKMAKSFKAHECANFNEDNCNCFFPDVDYENYICVIQRKQKELDYRNGREYIKWRKKVFERDQYTCQKCLQYGRTLNAHHIKPYKDFPELRFEVTNGITYCESCHREIHNGQN